MRRAGGASAPRQLTVFMKKYDPALARAALAKMRIKSVSARQRPRRPRLGRLKTP